MLKDFDKRKLKIVKDDCVGRYVYDIDYVKNINKINLLYLIIPEFYGYIEEHEGRKYLNIAVTGINNDILSEYEKCVMEYYSKLIKLMIARRIFLKKIIIKLKSVVLNVMMIKII